MIKLSRRSFPACFSVLSTALPAAEKVSLPVNRAPQTLNPTQFCKRIDTVIGNWESVVQVGKLCKLSTCDGGENLWVDQFVNQLLASNPTREANLSHELRSIYQARIRDDFKLNRMRNIKGYLLSQSEVDVCSQVYFMLNIS